MGDRKARLAALAAKAGRSKIVPAVDHEEQQQEVDTTTSVSFRNYAPRDTSLETKSKLSSDNENESSSSNKRPRLGTDEVAERTAASSALEQALVEAQADLPKGTTTLQVVQQQTTTSINGDLRRDIATRIAKLEKRTQKALVELLKQRLEKEATEQMGEDGDGELD